MNGKRELNNRQIRALAQRAYFSGSICVTSDFNQIVFMGIEGGLGAVAEAQGTQDT